MPTDPATSRRAFLSRTLLGFAAAGIAWIVQACGGSTAPPAPKGPRTIGIDLTESRFAPLGSVGGTVTLDASALDGLPDNGIFLTRQSETSILCLDRTCTHQFCQVGSFGAGGIALCPCHGSRYSTTGAVVNGPARTALTRYDASLDGTTLTITL